MFCLLTGPPVSKLAAGLLNLGQLDRVVVRRLHDHRWSEHQHQGEGGVPGSGQTGGGGGGMRVGAVQCAGGWWWQGGVGGGTKCDSVAASSAASRPNLSRKGGGKDSGRAVKGSEKDGGKDGGRAVERQ